MNTKAAEQAVLNSNDKSRLKHYSLAKQHSFEMYIQTLRCYLDTSPKATKRLQQRLTNLRVLIIDEVR